MPFELLVASATDTGAGAGLPNPERTAGAASGEAAPLARVPLVVATVLILPTRRIVNRITSVAGAGADAGLPNPERTASAASGEAASPALVPPAVKTAHANVTISRLYRTKNHAASKVNVALSVM